MAERHFFEFSHSVLAPMARPAPNAGKALLHKGFCGFALSFLCFCRAFLFSLLLSAFLLKRKEKEEGGKASIKVSLIYF